MLAKSIEACRTISVYLTTQNIVVNSVTTAPVLEKITHFIRTKRRVTKIPETGDYNPIRSENYIFEE